MRIHVSFVAVTCNNSESCNHRWIGIVFFISLLLIFYAINRSNVRYSTELYAVIELRFWVSSRFFRQLTSLEWMYVILYLQKLQPFISIFHHFARCWKRHERFAAIISSPRNLFSLLCYAVSYEIEGALTDGNWRSDDRLHESSSGGLLNSTVYHRHTSAPSIANDTFEHAS